MVKASLEVRFGVRVREFRHAAGLSQLDMLSRGFTLSHFQKIERGVVDPRLSTILKLAEAFGVPPGKLLDKL
jgi:transcriptional regulator with XRE-family HTH domain